MAGVTAEVTVGAAVGATVGAAVTNGFAAVIENGIERGAGVIYPTRMATSRRAPRWRHGTAGRCIALLQTKIEIFQKERGSGRGPAIAARADASRGFPA